MERGENELYGMFFSYYIASNNAVFLHHHHQQRIKISTIEFKVFLLTRFIVSTILGKSRWSPIHDDGASYICSSNYMPNENHQYTITNQCILSLNNPLTGFVEVPQLTLDLYRPQWFCRGSSERERDGWWHGVGNFFFKNQ